MLKINFCLIEEDKDYEFQLKNQNLQKISIFQFKNFIKKLNQDENYIYELLSKCMISIKEKYKREFDSNKNEMNFLIIDPIIYRSYQKEIYDELLK
jgi:hypothetical protein